MPTDSRRERLAVAALSFGVATPVVYVLERVIEWARGPVEAPILGLFQIEYYSRVVVALAVGSAVALLVFALLARVTDHARSARRVGIVACALVPLGFIATWFVP